MVLVVLGAVFAVLGIAAVVTILLTPAPTIVVLGPAIFAATGLGLFIGGLFMVQAQRRRRRILAEGIPGTARIVSVTQTSVMVNNQPVMRLQLAVTMPDRPRYEVSVRRTIPFVLMARVQPGNTVGVRVDREDGDRLEIDWNAPVAQPAQVPAPMAEPAMPALPAVPDYLTNLPPEQLREQVRSIGVTGRAIVKAVQQTGATAETIGYLLDLWVQLDSGPAYHLANAPAFVESRYASRVAPGVKVPVRLAQLRPGVTMTVLEWDRL
jgi:hypothetical protein